MAGSVMDDAGFLTLVDVAYSQIVEHELMSRVDIIPELFTRIQGDRLDFLSGELGEMAPWSEFTTGQVSYQEIYEQYNTQQRGREYTSGSIVTRRLVDDDLFGVMTGKRFRPMVQAGLLTEQLHATRLYETMGIVDTHYYAYSEGVPLVSASHSTRTPGVSTNAGFSNRTSAAFSPTALQAALIAGRKIKNDQGYRTGTTYNGIVFPTDLRPRINQVLRTPYGLDTPYRNLNTENSPETGIMKMIELPHWSSTNNWALVNVEKMKAACLWIVRAAAEFGRFADFDTLQIKNRGYMRHGYGVVISGLYWMYGGIVS
jgi:hypothetical protein